MKAPCSVENCDRPHHAKGYCQSHYEKHARPKRPARSKFPVPWLHAKGRRAVETGMKVCVTCKVDKPLIEYHWGGWDRKFGDRRRYECRECAAKRSKAWREQNKHNTVYHDMKLEYDQKYNRRRTNKPLAAHAFQSLKDRIMRLLERTEHPDYAKRSAADARYMALMEQSSWERTQPEWDEIQLMIRRHRQQEHS